MYSLDNSEVRLCLTAARILTARGHNFQAERIFKQVLSQAEELDGEGPLTGLVLLDLHDFYEKAGRYDEARPVWERVRKILIRDCAKFLLAG